MSGLHRLASAFVAPAVDDPRPAGPASVAAAVAPASVAVVASARHARTAGAAVALGLGHGRGAVVLAMWGGAAGPALRAPALPATRRPAAKLSGRGFVPAVSGRLVAVTLEAPSDATRVAAAVDVPTVFVVGAPRDGEVDRVLAGSDRVVVAGHGVVAELAVDSVAALGVPAVVLTLPDAPLPRALAAAGVGLTGALRGATSA